MDIKGPIARQTLLSMYEAMRKIRAFEGKVAEIYHLKEIKCPVHLCIGQEAVAAGVCQTLKKEDYLFSNHRGHGHLIAKGAGLKYLMAELFGKKTGCSGARGGSMHLVDIERNVPGTSAIVGGGIPLAVGAALASSVKKNNRVSAAFFGDGAFDEGVFHESMNFAALKKLPVLFVCENNLYATNSPQRARHARCDIAGFAGAYGIKGVRVDGNDAIEVHAAAQEAVNNARLGRGPALIEAMTYRWMGHVGPEEDWKKGLREKTELDSWKGSCPIKKIKRVLLNENIAAQNEIDAIDARIEADVNEAVEFARKSPEPEGKGLFEGLFCE